MQGTRFTTFPNWTTVELANLTRVMTEAYLCKGGALKIEILAVFDYSEYTTECSKV